MNKKSMNLFKGNSMMRQYAGLLLIIALMLFGFSFSNENFFTFTNLIAIVKQASIYGIVGLGTCILSINAEQDISVGVIVAAAGTALTMASRAGANLFVCILIDIVIGVGLGTLNGIGVALTGMSSYILTMATTNIYRGLTYIISGGQPIPFVPEQLKWLGQGMIGGLVPVAVVFMVIIYAIGYYFMNYTALGRRFYARGGNEVAARYAGINIRKTVILSYAICGFLCSLAALVMTGKFASSQPTMGNGLDVDAIACAAIGGIGMDGGTGSVLGVFLGAVIIGIINNGMVMIGFDSYWQIVAKGVIIIVAVSVDIYRKKLMEK